MTETARVLLTAGILSAVALSVFVWRLTRPSREPHERLVGQLHLSQWAALILAGMGAVGIGQAVGAASAPGAMTEAVVGLTGLVAAVVVLRLEPSRALLVAGLCLLLHAGFGWAHRPFTLITLTSAFVPTWWSVSSAMYDVYIAILCFVGVMVGRARQL